MKDVFQTYRKVADNDLPHLVRNRNRKKAMAEIYRRFGHLVFGSCLKYLKNKQDAEDMVMDIFEHLEAQIIKHEITYFKSWLYQLTKNNCLMKLRKKEVNTTDVESVNIESEGEQNQVEEKILKEEKIQALIKAMNQLTEEQKSTLTKFYLERKSYQEISEELNLPLKKVKSAIQNGKRNLKLKLQENELFKAIS